MSHDDTSGMMHMPSPDFPTSGYAIGSAPAPAPEGMVFVPGLNTYVDHDIAAQLGLSAPTQSNGSPKAPHADLSLNPLVLPEELGREISEDELDEMSEEELEALVDELEARQDREPSLSPTLDEVADHFGPSFEGMVDQIVVGTSNDETVSDLAQSTGLDEMSVRTLMETAVSEAAPIAAEYIGGDCWQSLTYAAAATDDPFAKRVVADLVQGRLHPSKLAQAYQMWWSSLPDAEEV